MALESRKVYSLKTQVFTQDSVFSLAELLQARARQLVADESARAGNAEQAIIRDFSAQITTITDELARVRLMAETLGDGELSQIEDALLKVLNQPAFQALLSGGSLEGFKLSSVVATVARQPDIATEESDHFIHGVATVKRITMTDNSSAVFSASIVGIPADAEAGTPERMEYRFVSPDFLGLPATFVALYDVSRFPGSDKAWLTEVRVDNIVFDLTRLFESSGAAQVLSAPDLNADGAVGIPAPAPEPADPGTTGA